MTKVLLVGSMGTGKTTVGAAIAARTGWPAVDNDALLEQTTGCNGRDLLARDGEAALRRAESDVLTRILALPAPLVAGVAAGVVMDPADRQRLRAGGQVVWLRATVDTLVQRLAAGPGGRAWLGEDPRAVLARLDAQRAPLYAQVASQLLAVEGHTPAELAAQVLAALPPPVR